jgi:hypothetical protein
MMQEILLDIVVAELETSANDDEGKDKIRPY